MYRLSRLLLMLGATLGFYCFVVLVAFCWPWTGVGIALLLVAKRLDRAWTRRTTLGSARWAEEADLRRAGMLQADAGLLLGRIQTTQSVLRGLQSLFSWRTSAKAACRAIWAGFRRSERPIVRLPQAIHTTVFGPSGGGKGVSCVIPFLLTCDESCVVIDFKGENARLTAEHRRKALGQQVVVLDPYRQVTSTPDALNPLAFIDPEDSLAIDECNDLANALVIRTGEEREPHWNDSAEAWIAAMIATVARYGEPQNGTRSLQTVRDLLSDRQKLDMAIKLMIESDAWGGMLARMGHQLEHFVEKERSSTLTTVSRHLRFLDTVAVSESTKSSTFDPAGLRTGKMTTYLILPPDHMRAQSALLRMWIGSLLRAVIRGGLQEAKKVHFILDEAASLGHLDVVDDAIDKYRGYGVRLQLYYQSLGQLKRCFPEGQEQTLLSNTSQVFFGVNDPATADFVSARLGEQTIVVDSGGTNSGVSYSATQGAHPQSSSGSSSGSSTGWQQQARRLLKPEEVMMLPPRTAITFTPGVAPVCTTLIRYYEEKNLGRRDGRVSRFCKALMTFVAATVWCVVMLVLAAALTQFVNDVTAVRLGGTRVHVHAVSPRP